MGARGRRPSGRALRPPMRSPGRPPGWRREHKQRLWQAIARGLSSGEAAATVGVASAVGTRWFREGGGMSTVSSTPVSDRYLSFAEREEIAILRAQHCGRARGRANRAVGRGHRGALRTVRPDREHIGWLGGSRRGRASTAIRAETSRRPRLRAPREHRARAGRESPRNRHRPPMGRSSQRHGGLERQISGCADGVGLQRVVDRLQVGGVVAEVGHRPAGVDDAGQLGGGAALLERSPRFRPTTPPGRACRSGPGRSQGRWGSCSARRSGG
jgi:hypothetical protein